MLLLNDIKKPVLETMANYVGLKGFLEIKWKEIWQEPLIFRADVEFWHTLFSDDFGEYLFMNKGKPIHLQDFKLTTWLPFIPGLYYKRSAVDNFQLDPKILRKDEGSIILDMKSKTEYVLNGFANIRYDRIKIGNEIYLMLNAYTSSNTCLGIPVLIRDRDFNFQNLHDIEKRMKFEIHGVLDYFVSDDEKFQFAPFANKIPVIKAEHRFAVKETGEHLGEAEASAWSLVDIWDNKFKKPCCVFSSIRIGDRNSIRDANNFIKDYIQNEYRTKKYNIVTDYDEISPSLNAEFGIRDISRNELLIHKFRDIRKRYNL